MKKKLIHLLMIQIINRLLYFLEKQKNMQKSSNLSKISLYKIWMDLKNLQLLQTQNYLQNLLKIM